MIFTIEQHAHEQAKEKLFTPENLQNFWKSEDEVLLNMLRSIYFDVFTSIKKVLKKYGGSDLLSQNHITHSSPLTNLVQFSRPKIVWSKQVLGISTWDDYGCLETIFSTWKMSLYIYPVKIRALARIRNLDYKTTIISVFCHEMMHFASTEFDPILNKVRQVVSDTVSPWKNFMIGDPRYFFYKSWLQVKWYNEWKASQLPYDLTGENEAMTDILAREVFVELRTKLPDLIKNEYYIGYPNEVAVLEQDLHEKSEKNGTTSEEEFTKIVKAYTNSSG